MKTIKTKFPHFVEADDYHDFKWMKAHLEEFLYEEIFFEELEGVEDIDSPKPYKAIFYLKGQKRAFKKLKKEIEEAYRIEDK